jgi:DNA primase
MFDVAQIKENADLMALLGDAVQLRKVATGEYAGPCPKCGGDDRFHVTPTWFFCRLCHDKRGDAIEFLQWRDGMTFLDACEALGGAKDALERPGLAHLPKSAQIRPLTRPTVAPCEAWQTRARAFCSWAVGQLWETPAALAYLRGRGLSAGTIFTAGLGWNPRAMRDKPDTWGLDGGPVYLAEGLVIPCELDGVLWYVKVRQPKAEPRYLAIRGSVLGGVLYLAPGPMRPDMILTEGEINALSSAQVLGVVCSVGSLGAAGNLPGAQALGHLVRVARLWARYDGDAAGQHGRDRLGELSARVRPLSWPFDACKDPSDALQAGHDLAAWAVPQLGPTDPDHRCTWLEAHLAELDAAALAAGTDDSNPALRAWLALYWARDALGWTP